MRCIIEFTTSEKFLSKLIRKFQKHGASHCRVRYEHIEPVVLEATLPVVIERPDCCMPNATVLKSYVLEIPVGNILRARKRLGRWYDSGNLFLILMQKAAHYLGVKFRSWKSNPHQDICVDVGIDVVGADLSFEKTDLDGFIDYLDEKVGSGELSGVVVNGKVS